MTAGTASTEGRAAVRIEVALDDLRAGASVSCLGPELPESAVRAAAARAWLIVADQAGEAGRLALGEVALRAGAGALGDSYLAEGVEDDTGMKLLAADSTGDPEQRFHLLERVLSSRITLYGWRHDDVDLLFDPPSD